MNLTYYSNNELHRDNSMLYEITGYNEDYLKEHVYFSKVITDTLHRFFYLGAIGTIMGRSFYPLLGSSCLDKKALILRPCTNDNKEENLMSRRIGNFINPQNGEPDWLEPETIELVILQPTMITRVGETVQTPIDFKLGNNEDNKTITITAKYTVSTDTYQSDPIAMDENEFAEQFAQQVYSDKALDEAAIVKDAKEAAVKDLSRRLMDNNVLIGGLKLNGLGFVIVDSDKIMTIEDFEFQYRIENGRGIKTVVLKNCVGNASLQNLANPEIRFYSETHTVECVRPEVVSHVEGRLKDYTVNIEDIRITAESAMPEHVEFSKVNIDNEDDFAEFVQSRKSMLDDNLNLSEADIEDRLSDFL